MALPTPTLRQLIARPVDFLSFGFGAGLSPVAPGTAGTVVAIPLFIIAAWLTSWPVFLALTIAMFALGCWLCEKTSQHLGVHDHGGIVWDEIVGYFITMFPIIYAGFEWNWEFVAWLGLGFVLFRIFDILKPFPIALVDRQVKGGFGIMIDDVIAGLDAAIVIYAIQLYQAGRFDAALG